MNKKFLKHYMETEPEGTSKKYIFLVDNQDIAMNIVISGYQALYLGQEDDGYYFSVNSFIEDMRSIQFHGTCQSAYHYVAACTTKWMNNRILEFCKESGLDGKAGWQLFKEKEYLGKLDNQPEVGKTLEQFILRFEREPKNDLELSRFHKFDSKGKVTGVRDMEIVDYIVENVMILLRAFYARLSKMNDENTVKTKEIIASCIWKVDEFDNPDKNRLKIDSEVSTDEDKEEFISILKNGEATKNMKSKYADTYRFFEEKIQEFLNEYPSYFAFLPNRVLKNCILLPIEAESQDTALRIFSTLNDRGKPLSDTDIFKAQLYKYYSLKGEKDEFIARWKELEMLSEQIFSFQSGSPMDELFTKYMYYLRAKQGNRKTTTEALRKFFEKNGYVLLGKTFTVDPISKRRLANMGEENQYYIRDHHEAIVSREIWDKAEEIRLKRAKPKLMQATGNRERYTRQLGNVICEFIPVNLIIIFFLINIGFVFLRKYLEKKYFENG